MLQLQKLLTNLIKTISSDLRTAMISIGLASLLAGGTMYLFARYLWKMFKSVMQAPTPLWATTALVLLVVLYVQIKIKSNFVTSQDLPVKKPKIKFFDVGNYRWKAIIHRPDYFELDKYPYCPVHDTRFVFSRDRKFCPGTNDGVCENNLSNRDDFKEYESAKSIIESRIRNNKKCYRDRNGHH